MTPLQVLCGIHAPRQCPAYGKTCVGCGKMGHFNKVCWSRRERAVNELEVKEVQEVSAGEIETLRIDSVHQNKNLSLLTVKLEMYTGRNTIVVPYKVDTGS